MLLKDLIPSIITRYEDVQLVSAKICKYDIGLQKTTLNISGEEVK